MDGLDKLTTDARFELLSAYIDGELSAGERKQVEAWLESDPEMQRQYQTLSSLSRSFQALPTPQSSASADEMLDAVFSKVERQPRALKIAGIGAAVVAVIGALSALFSSTILSPQMASRKAPATSQVASQKTSERSSKSINTMLSTDIVPADIEAMDTDSLMLVLEAPPVEIPVVADSSLSDSTEF